MPGYGRASSTKLDPLTLNALRASAERGARWCRFAPARSRWPKRESSTACARTTHWASCDELARQHPTVSVDASVLFVDNDTVLTSGGVTAGIDLLL